MDDVGFWITPLLLLPGVGMLVMSTSNRYQRLHDELHDLVEHRHATPPGFRGLLTRRARLFQGALTALYGSVTVLAFAGLSGVTAEFTRWPGVQELSAGLTVVAVLLVLVASALLVAETRHSRSIIQYHIEMLPDE